MSSDLYQFNRRGIDAILQRHGIDDDALAEELQQHSWAVRSWQPSGPAAPKHPGIVMIERIAGRQVPPAISESILSDLGDATEEQLKAARVDWIKKNPRNAEAWTWVSWAKHAGKDNRKKAAGQPEQQPRGFSGLQEWMTTNGQD